MNKSSKEQHVFETEIVCNIHVFTGINVFDCGVCVDCNGGVCDVSHLSVFTPVALHGHWRLTQLVFHVGNFCWGEADQVEMIWITEHYLWN